MFAKVVIIGPPGVRTQRSLRYLIRGRIREVDWKCHVVVLEALNTKNRGNSQGSGYSA